MIAGATAPVEAASRWRRSLPVLAGLVLAALLLYRDTAAAMVGIWSRSETFAHAFLVLPLSAWLIWRARRQVIRLPPQAQPLWAPAILAAAAAWLVADLAGVDAGAQFALVTMLILTVPAVLGARVTAALLFPLLFVYFAVPFGEFLLPTLMDATADFTVFALKASGIPVYREGLQFVIPSGNWSVVEACSGVRYLIASFMVGTLFAYLNYRSSRRRLVFMAVSLLVPVVANWLRAYMIVMLGHLSDNRLAVGVDHLLYGWIFFGIVVTIMFAIGARWADADTAPERRPALPAAAPATAHADRPLLTAALAALALALPQLWMLREAVRSPEGPAPAWNPPAELAPGWSLAPGRAPPLRPHFVNPSSELEATYTGPAGTVSVHLAYYAGGSPKRRLASSVNVLVASDDPAWNLVSNREREVALAGSPLPVRESRIVPRSGVLQVPRDEVVVWRLYWVDGRWLTDDSRTKLAIARSRLSGGDGDGVALVLMARESSAAASVASLEEFLRANLARIGQSLSQYAGLAKDDPNESKRKEAGR